MSKSLQTDAGDSDTDAEGVLQRAQNLFLGVVYMVAALEAKAFLLETGHLPIVPFKTGTGEFADDIPVELEEFIADVAWHMECVNDLDDDH